MGVALMGMALMGVALMGMALFSSCFKGLTSNKFGDLIIIFFLYGGCSTRNLLLELLCQLPQVVQVIWPWK